jgi:hypothetical protein
MCSLPCSQGRVGVGSLFASALTHRHQHSIDLGNDIAAAEQSVVVPEAQYTVTLPFEGMGANLVVRQRIEMLSTIKLDDHMRRQAHKIHDVPDQRILPPEFIASQLLSPQEIPQAALGIGAFVSQFSSAGPSALHGESFAQSCMAEARFTPSQPSPASRGRSNAMCALPCLQGRAGVGSLFA